MPTNNSRTMQLSSSVFAHNGYIPPKYTCDGDDINPPLSFSDIPENTVSLALIMHDPDAQKEGGWTHWLIWNIGPSVSGIDENSVPEGSTEGTSDFDDQSYGGPCPSSGIHHYNFTLYALDSEIALESSADKEALDEALKGHIIDEAKYTGLYTSE